MAGTQAERPRPQKLVENSDEEEVVAEGETVEIKGIRYVYFTSCY